MGNRVLELRQSSGAGGALTSCIYGSLHFPNREVCSFLEHSLGNLQPFPTPTLRVVILSRNSERDNVQAKSERGQQRKRGRKSETRELRDAIPVSLHCPSTEPPRSQGRGRTTRKRRGAAGGGGGLRDCFISSPSLPSRPIEANTDSSGSVNLLPHRLRTKAYSISGKESGFPGARRSSSATRPLRKAKKVTPLATNKKKQEKHMMQNREAASTEKTRKSTKVLSRGVIRTCARHAHKKYANPATSSERWNSFNEIFSLVRSFEVQTCRTTTGGEGRGRLIVNIVLENKDSHTNKSMHPATRRALSAWCVS